MSGPRNCHLLRRVRERSAPGTRLLPVDFFTDPTQTRPEVATLLAGSFLTGYGDGDAYSEDEVGQWLAGTGWRTVDSQTLAVATRLIVATTI